MTPQRRKRLYLVLGIVVGVGVAAALALSAFRQNVTFYFIPTQVAAGEVHGDQSFRPRRHGQQGQRAARGGQSAGELRADGFQT